MPRKPTPDPSQAIAYIRCSTSRQDLSPDAQRAAIAAWAEREGVEVIATHEDIGVSGGAPIDKRPGLLAALDALKAEGAGFLVVAKRDRLARDVLVAAMVERLCERSGARLTSACGVGNGTGPGAQLLRQMVDAFAQYERALIGARTKAALAAKKARGERVGGIPYGMRLGEDGKLVEEPRERAAIELARALRAEGNSLRAIAGVLDEAGHQPRTGKKWHVQILARMTGAIPGDTAAHGSKPARGGS